MKWFPLTSLALAAAIPQVLANDITTTTTELCYSRVAPTSVESVPTSFVAPVTTSLTRTRTVSYTPLAPIAAGAEEAKGVKTTTIYLEETITITSATTIATSHGFTPIRSDKYIKSLHPHSLYRRDRPAPRERPARERRGLRKNQEPEYPSEVICEQHVEEISYTTTTATAPTSTPNAHDSELARVRASSGSSHSSSSSHRSSSSSSSSSSHRSTSSSSTVTVFVTNTETYFVPESTHYAGCHTSGDNLLYKINGTALVSFQAGDNVQPADPDAANDAYSCCVACQKLEASFTCGGFLFDPALLGPSGIGPGGTTGNNGNGNYCILVGGAVSEYSDCQPQEASWGIYNQADSGINSGGYLIGNGQCGQAEWYGTVQVSD